jgi:polar amino acid transport system substrate-binding protein
MRFLVFILFNIISDFCFAKNEIVLAAEDSWPPFSQSDGTGISQQIISRAFQETGVNVKYVTVPYARALHMAQVGEVDGAFNVTKQSSTSELFRFGDEALLHVSASFYYTAHSNFDLKSIADAPDGLVIALIIGYEYGELYEQNRARFNEIRVSNQKQIIRLLMKNRVDVAIMFDDVARYYLTEMQLTSDAIKKGHINHISDIYVAFNKDKPELRDYINKLDIGLRIIRTQSY